MNIPFGSEVRTGGASDVPVSSHLNSSGSSNSSNLEWLRMYNMISQDFPSYWPYNQSMSPIGPTGVAIFPTTYALTPLYPASPILSQYEHLRYIPRTGSNARKTESSNTNIQISLQCMNQNNPVKINTWNDMSMLKVPVESEAVTKHVDSPYRHVPVQSPSKENDCDTDVSIMKDVQKNPGSFTLAVSNGPAMIDKNFHRQEKFAELTRLAMRGCELAERLAYTHRNRPCFKKIDSLCARMKQDLIRPDGVLPNINSQGIAWAVKDFIFVFTRIINAWIIIKGYVYNTAEGLSRVKSSLTPEFNKSFTAWQESTIDFVENIIKSFLNLDQLEQSQRALQKDVKVSSTPLKDTSNINSEIDENIEKLLDDSYEFLTESFANEDSLNESSISALHKSYFSTLVEDSEESQRKATANGTYFKTGVYNPIQKESNTGLDSTCVKKHDPSIDQNSSIVNDNGVNSVKFAKSNAIIGSDNKTLVCPLFYLKPNEISPTEKPSESQRLETTSDRNLPPMETTMYNQTKEKPVSLWNPFDLRVFEKKQMNSGPTFDPTIAKPNSSVFIMKLEVLLQRISNISGVEYFFNAHFTRNYFPDFMAKHSNWMDIRSIILKAQTGGYLYLFEIVHDITLIIYHAKIYLKTNRNELLSKSISEYEKGVDSILSEKLFQNWQIDHIIEYMIGTNKPIW